MARRRLAGLAFAVAVALIASPLPAGEAGDAGFAPACGAAEQPASSGDELAQACCKKCSKGCPCGDTCISCAKTCRTPPGCACRDEERDRPA